MYALKKKKLVDRKTDIRFTSFSYNDKLGFLYICYDCMKNKYFNISHFFLPLLKVEKTTKNTRIYFLKFFFSHKKNK